MRAVLDTCVIIDALQNRQPFSTDAEKILIRNEAENPHFKHELSGGMNAKRI